MTLQDMTNKRQMDDIILYFNSRKKWCIHHGGSLPCNNELDYRLISSEHQHIINEYVQNENLTIERLEPVKCKSTIVSKITFEYFVETYDRELTYTLLCPEVNKFDDLQFKTFGKFRPLDNKQPTKDDLKVLWATGDYTAICMNTAKGIQLVKENPNWENKLEYRLFHNDHLDILKAVLEDYSLEVEFQSNWDDDKRWFVCNNFLGYYTNPNAVDWRFKEPVFGSSDDIELLKQDLEDFDKLQPEILSIKDDNGKEYKFEKPDFDCELLKVVGGEIIGYITKPIKEDRELASAITWMLDGITQLGLYEQYELTPIKSKWYEVAAYPCIIINIKYPQRLPLVANRYLGIDTIEVQSMNVDASQWRLATDEEINQLKQSV